MGKCSSEASTDFTFFNEKVAPHYSSIVKFVVRISNDVHLAYDIAQDTMVDAWKYRDKMRSYDNFEAALIKIASNKLKMYFKKYKNYPALIPLEEIEDSKLENKADETVESIVMGIETGEEFKRALSLLDEKFARVLILHHYYGFSLKEIAKLYGVNYNTVRSWHIRAIKKFKEYCNKNEDMGLYIVEK